jgi:hexulose-6-phosphate isomerase
MSPMEAARFVDEIGSPAVGWHFDIGNVITYGWPDQWVRILGPRILNLHLKDFSRRSAIRKALAKALASSWGKETPAGPT